MITVSAVVFWVLSFAYTVTTIVMWEEWKQNYETTHDKFPWWWNLFGFGLFFTLTWLWLLAILVDKGHKLWKRLRQ